MPCPVLYWKHRERRCQEKPNCLTSSYEAGCCRIAGAPLRSSWIPIQHVCAPFSCMILIPTTSTHSLSSGRAPLKLFELLCTHRCPGDAWVDLRQWLTDAPWWGHSEYSLCSSSLWDQAEHSPWKTVHALSLLFGFFTFLVMPPSLPWKLLLVKHLHTHPHPKICIWGTWWKTKENKYSFLLYKQLALGGYFSCLNSDRLIGCVSKTLKD